MAGHSSGTCREQRVSMKCLVNESIKPVDIYRGLQAQLGAKALSCSKTFEWCKRFTGDRISVSDDLGRGDSQFTVTIPVNIQQVERRILNNPRVTCCEVAKVTHLSVGTVKLAWWPPNPPLLSLARLARLPSCVRARAAAQSASATPTANCSRLQGVLTAAKPHATCVLRPQVYARECMNAHPLVCPLTPILTLRAQLCGLLRYYDTWYACVCLHGRTSLHLHVSVSSKGKRGNSEYVTMMVGDSSGNVYVYAMKNFPEAGSANEEAEKLNSILLSCFSSQVPT
ncbi:hypothetical protein EGR_04589 [Echinococcus granulosus]|uniref:Uncharacterized protein n=1 Tax=Echinococcus granulosus TaxID=6210 RepID=W6UGE5_ECHGR|nr:hypothetical protein EGR_04589 [Echinococcus granulosus]EUB60570.1 hypothetical protein EGR_04589 [Echinococcus granulosus]